MQFNVICFLKTTSSLQNRRQLVKRRRALLESKLITNILGSTQDEYILANLAAGPLETLLGRHGKKLIADVEHLAKSDPRFRSLLQGVWQNLMDDQTWGRVLKAAKG